MAERNEPETPPGNDSSEASARYQALPKFRRVRRPTTISSWWTGVASFGLIIVLFVFLLPAFQGPRSRQVSPCRRNLKCILIALHHYHDEFGCLPPAFIRDSHGLPAHSWRVLILPFMGDPQLQELYDDYRFTEPWNGPNNRRLLSRMPDQFRCPFRETDDPTERWMTPFTAPRGENTAFAGAAPRRMDDLTDGLSNTIVLVEIAEYSIPWLAPDDISFEQYLSFFKEKQPQNSTPYGFVGLADGSVRYLNWETRLETPRRLLTIDDGVRFDW